MIDVLDTYDWQEAFAAAGERQREDGLTYYESGYQSDVPFNPVDLRRAPDSPTPLDHFTREDVSHIEARWEDPAPGEEGEGGATWEGVVLGRLKDGRWFTVEGGCDYTGWDCQSGCTAFVGPDREHVIAFGLDARLREKLGLPA